MLLIEPRLFIARSSRLSATIVSNQRAIIEWSKNRLQTETVNWRSSRTLMSAVSPERCNHRYLFHLNKSSIPYRRGSRVTRNVRPPRKWIASTVETVNVLVSRRESLVDKTIFRPKDRLPQRPHASRRLQHLRSILRDTAPSLGDNSSSRYRCDISSFVRSIMGQLRKVVPTAIGSFSGSRARECAREREKISGVRGCNTAVSTRRSITQLA